MLPIVIGLGAGFGLFFLWIYLTGSRRCDRRLCPVIHEVGPAVLTHYATVDCADAIEVAKAAGEVWNLLETPFPSRPERFILRVILDLAARAGWVTVQDVVVINLGYPRGDGKKLLGWISEELHHLCYLLAARAAGKEVEYVFNPKEDIGPHEDVVLYYALNEHEYQALRFAAAVSGERAQLLEEVEQYRALHVTDKP